MKRFRIYVWVAAFIFAANAWLSYVLPSSKSFSPDQSPMWQVLMTRIAVISQLPSLPVSKAIADFFNLSYPGWAITSSVVSMLIYFPLIHLLKPWKPRVRLNSISQKLSAFSSSLNPCGCARKNHSSALNETNALSHSEKHA